MMDLVEEPPTLRAALIQSLSALTAFGIFWFTDMLAAHDLFTTSVDHQKGEQVAAWLLIPAAAYITSVVLLARGSRTGWWLSLCLDLAPSLALGCFVAYSAGPHPSSDDLDDMSPLILLLLAFLLPCLHLFLPSMLRGYRPFHRLTAG